MRFKRAKINGEGVPEITCEEVHEATADVKLIDVRRPDEFTGELGHVEGSELSTLETSFAADLNGWPRDQAYVFICKSGGRSTRATAYAQSLGFREVYNMEGGMVAWNSKKLPTAK